MQLRHILSPVDFSEATPSGVGIAVALAQRFGARITLLHSLPALQMPFRVPVDADDLYDQWDREAQERLDALVQDIRSDGVAVQTRLARGSAAHQIADEAEELDVDLVVLPTHSRVGFDRLLYGSVSERVVRVSTCPVLTVPPDRDSRSFEPGRVLIATDFSRSADAALEVAVDVASSFAAELVLAHVFTFEHVSDEGTEWWRPTLTKDQVEEAIAAATSRLQALAERAHRSGVETSVDISQGANPAAEIVRIAEEEKVDLVVAGKHGAGFFKHLLLGSTAEKLVRSCPVPLLITPPPVTEESEGTIPDPVPA